MNICVAAAGDCEPDVFYPAVGGIRIEPVSIGENRILHNVISPFYCAGSMAGIVMVMVVPLSGALSHERP